MCSDTERFLAKTERHPSGCLLWVGALVPGGYGHFWFEGKPQSAHRVAHKLFIGPIPEGMQVNHTCDVKLCVEPTHLYAGTQSDNQRDAVSRGRHKETKKRACIRGHAFTPENTYVRPDGRRRCRECQRGYT